MKKLALLCSLFSTFIYADENLGDGYQTIIPCFRFNVSTPDTQTGKFEYALLSNGKVKQKGKIVTTDDKANYIQWCDNELSHVQRQGSLHNIANKYTLVINGIVFKNLIVGTSISLDDHIENSTYDNKDYTCAWYSQSGFDCVLDHKDDTLKRSVSIKYNDILASNNTKFIQAQYGTGQKIRGFSNPPSDPLDGDYLTYNHNEDATNFALSIFRKSWLISDLIIPRSISNYHPLNTRNLKLEDTTPAMQYTKIIYDDNDVSSQAIIDYNFKAGPKQYFSGFCSGIGVINDVIYAACRNNINTEVKYNNRADRFNGDLRQYHTSLSYKTACVMSDYDYSGHKTKVALLKNDSNGALRCVLYNSDFPQGEYLNSCPGINYDPTHRTLTTDCYDNNQKLTHHITKLGVMGSQTPRYKNVNGSLVAY